jgi:hypothetical protein
MFRFGVNFCDDAETRSRILFACDEKRYGNVPTVVSYIDPQLSFEFPDRWYAKGNSVHLLQDIKSIHLHVLRPLLPALPLAHFFFRSVPYAFAQILVMFEDRFLGRSFQTPARQLKSAVIITCRLFIQNKDCRACLIRSTQSCCRLHDRIVTGKIRLEWHIGPFGQNAGNLTREFARYFGWDSSRIGTMNHTVCRGRKMVDTT